MLFPTKLHFILEIVSKDPKLSDIVSWLPCGRAFKIHDPVAFANIVLPKYFVGMHSFRSFRRQLNIYGIKKLLNKSRCLSLFLDDGDDASEETAPRPTISPHASKDERQGKPTTSDCCCLSSRNINSHAIDLLLISYV